MKQVGDRLLRAGTLAHTHTVSRAYDSMLDDMVDNYPRLCRIRLVWNINFGDHHLSREWEKKIA